MLWGSPRGGLAPRSPHPAQHRLPNLMHVPGASASPRAVQAAACPACEGRWPMAAGTAGAIPVRKQTASRWSPQPGTAPPAAHQQLAVAGQPCSAHRGLLEELLKTPPLPDTLPLVSLCVPSLMTLPRPPADRGQAELSSGWHAPALPTAEGSGIARALGEREGPRLEGLAVFSLQGRGGKDAFDQEIKSK